MMPDPNRNVDDLRDIEEFDGVVPAAELVSKPFHLPETIPQGGKDKHGRHLTLFKLLRSLKAKGLSFDAARAACDIEKNRCEPPLDEKDLEYQRWWDEADQPNFGKKFATYQKGSKKGEIVADSQGNVRLALAQLGLEFSYNAFAAKALVAHQGETKLIDDVFVHRAWLEIDELFHFRPSLKFFEIVLGDLAHRNSFHPVRDYLNRLTWDNEPRINNWLATYGGAVDTTTQSEADDSLTYLEAVSSIFFIAAVRRVRSPGAKLDELIILEAPQGTLKSSALRALCPDDNWFSDDLPLGVDAKQVIERTGGKWIIEASELQGYTNAQVDHLKGMTARQVDGPVRLAYGHTSTEVPRQFVMIGTTNKLTEYLRDSTGNRRFWPVRIAQFDVKALAENRDQLWAEAAHREAKGESIRLPDRLWPAAAVEQDARRQVDPWEELLDQRFDLTSDVILVESLWAALGDAGKYFKRNDAERLTHIMQRFGYTRKKKIDVTYIPVKNGVERAPLDPVRKYAWLREGKDLSRIDVRQPEPDC